MSYISWISVLIIAIVLYIVVIIVRIALLYVSTKRKVDLSSLPWYSVFMIQFGDDSLWTGKTGARQADMVWAGVNISGGIRFEITYQEDLRF